MLNHPKYTQQRSRNSAAEKNNTADTFDDIEENAHADSEEESTSEQMQMPSVEEVDSIDDLPPEFLETTSAEGSTYESRQAGLEHYINLLAEETAANPKPEIGLDIDYLIYQDAGKYKLLTSQMERKLCAEMEEAAIAFAEVLFSSRTIIEYSIAFFASSAKAKDSAQTIFDFNTDGKDSMGRTGTQRHQLRVEKNLETVGKILADFDSKSREPFDWVYVEYDNQTVWASYNV